MQTIDLGSRRELFVDNHLIDRLGGEVSLRLLHPTPREPALVWDKPWESRALGYITVFKDDDRYRMYYKGALHEHVVEQVGEMYGTDDLLVCYAESHDGIHWTKPSLGLHAFAGSTDNNIVWKGRGSHGFAPFIDTRPGCPPEERYKAFGRSKVREADKDQPGGPYWRMLFALTSPDGINWTVKEGPKRHGSVLDRDDGYFDSQNVGFWDETLGAYRLYLRKKRPVQASSSFAGRDDGDGGVEKQLAVRDICLSTSTDFVNWSTPAFLGYTGNVPDEDLYINQIQRYHRVPHIFLGFPSRYVEARGALTEQHERAAEERPGRYFTSYTDGLLMSSRDGKTFHRWREAFLRPGMPEAVRWAYGECFSSWGMIETASPFAGAPDELSLYVNEGARFGDEPMVRRHTLRKDGFVSVNATATGGELLTPPLTFAGDQLRLNMSTSAAGGIQVELQNPEGDPIEGFKLDQSSVLFGNAMDKPAHWTGGRLLSELAGQPIRIRFVMHDADLYALRFSADGP